jgi:hypothetical protein
MEKSEIQKLTPKSAFAKARKKKMQQQRVPLLL